MFSARNVTTGYLMHCALTIRPEGLVLNHGPERWTHIKIWENARHDGFDQLVRLFVRQKVTHLAAVALLTKHLNTVHSFFLFWFLTRVLG